MCRNCASLARSFDESESVLFKEKAVYRKFRKYDIKKLREGVVKCVSTSAIGNSVPLDVGAQQLTAIMS